MFLDELNVKERKNFLELAYYAMNVDGKVWDEELEVFNNFRAEARLSEEDYSIQNKDIDLIIREFQSSTKKIKKAVLFELFGIILSNDEYHENQEGLVNKLIEKWNFRNYHANKIRRWVEDFNDMLLEAYMFIEK